MKRFLTAAAAVLSLMAATSAMAGAAPYDHLECFKITDQYSFYAMVDVTAQPGNSLGLGLQSGCKVILKSREFCIPVQKTVIETDDPNVLPVIGQDLLSGFLCYKMKCPSGASGTISVGDQFGVRNVSPTTVTRICAPADW